MSIQLAHLNPQQRQAVLHGDGPMLVLAGAGSGKTQVITCRIARLIADGHDPQTIAGMTFTNKAAAEMRERLARLVGRRAREVWLGTFHALGLAILREDAAAAGLAPGFCIYDRGDQLGLVRELMRHIKLADRRLDAARVLDLLLRTKLARRDEVELLWGDDYELAAFDLYPRYLEQMRAFNAVDFDDLLLRAHDVLAQPEPRRRWSSRFRHLLVDEYQDTSPDQLALVRVLSGDHLNVCAVGDDDQAIYAWRGAAVDNVLAFSRQFAGTLEVVLDQNYRSTGNILAAANAVIANNQKRKPKRLWSAYGDGDPVEVVACADGDDEAVFVAEMIGKLCFQGVAPEEIAVLYRSNVQSRAFEETLSAERIAFRVVGGQAFFDRKEVRDVVAFLAVASNPADELALRRIINVPARGIGVSSLERLLQDGAVAGDGLWGALQRVETIEGLPKHAVAGARQFVDLMKDARARLTTCRRGELGPAVRALIDRIGLRESIVAADDAPKMKQRRLEHLAEVARAVERFESHFQGRGAPLVEFLRSSALVRSPPDAQDGDCPPVGQVTLMTLHGAKGLEFPYVFLVGMEDELLPHRKTVAEGGDICEERRLCYVGMTRAKRRLWLTHALRRQRYGRDAERTPSRFLDELPGDGAIVVRRSRDGAGGAGATQDEAASEAMANDFFRRMRERLGIED